MMKHVIILFSIFILAQSQRPPYAGNAKPYPAVLPQYMDEQAAAAAAAAAATTGATAAAAPAAGTGTGAAGDIANRIDSSSTTFTTSQTASTTNRMTTQAIPSDLPVDALGDINLINKIKTWPRDKQPFWFINWQQIQEHRGDTTNRRPPEMRSG